LFKSENEESKRILLEKKNVLFNKLESKECLKKTASVMIEDFKKHNPEQNSVLSMEINKQTECFKNRLKNKISRIRQNQRRNLFAKVRFVSIQIFFF